jgi:hypothetical protein
VRRSRLTTRETFRARCLLLTAKLAVGGAAQTFYRAGAHLAIAWQIFPSNALTGVNRTRNGGPGTVEMVVLTEIVRIFLIKYYFAKNLTF